MAAFSFTTESMAQVPNYVPTNGLVGYWPFNGNANDESGNGNHGTVNGATLTSDRSGNSDKAFYFSSAGCDTRIDADVNTSSIQEAYTFSYWFLQTGQGCIAPRTFEFSTGQNASGFLQSQNWNNYHSVTFIAGTAPYSSLICPAPINGEWANITLTVNLTGAKLYFNGVIADSVSFNTNFLSLNGDMCMGRMNHPAYDAHEGKLDDIGIWNRALSAQEISDLYNSNPCSNDLSISPTSSIQNIGANSPFTATTSDPNAAYLWQSDLGQGFQTLNNYGNYSGVNTNTLTISNVQLSNHNQQIRAISTSGNCIDTSNIATIQIADTCITNVTVYDTLLTTVTDTLIINTTLSLPAPNNENTILIYPNPASDHITIDNGNYSAMAGYSIKITNNAGQEVFMNAINQAQFYVDLSTWTGNGLYFVHLIDSQNNTVTVRKIVLQ